MPFILTNSFIVREHINAPRRRTCCRFLLHLSLILLFLARLRSLTIYTTRRQGTYIWEVILTCHVNDVLALDASHQHFSVAYEVLVSLSEAFWSLFLDNFGLL